jgi:nucleoside-diphosphate-sugar epimerase
VNQDSAGSPWLVTGATGFLGRHVLEQLAPSASVFALVRDLDEWRRLEWTGSLSQVTPVRGDLTASGIETPALGGILHLAAYVCHRPAEAERVMRTNVDGTLNMVRLAARHRCRMILVSTSGTVGCFRDPDRIAYEEAPFCETEVRRWPYYRSKIEAERQGRDLADQLGVELVIVRPPILLGPGDHRHRSTAHVKRLMDGRVPFVIAGGMHYADIRDVAAALIRIMRLPAPRPVYHLPGIQCSIEAFYRQIAELAAVRPPRRTIPYWLAWTAAVVSSKLHLHLLPEPTLVEMAAHFWGLGSRYAESELGYRSRSGAETLRNTIQWLRENPS